MSCQLQAASYKAFAANRLQLIACGLQLIPLSLALLKAGILFVDNVQLALSPHNLAINTALFNGCSDFHIVVIYLYLNIILPLLKSYGLISTPTLSPGRIRM